MILKYQKKLLTRLKLACCVFANLCFVVITYVVVSCRPYFVVSLQHYFAEQLFTVCNARRTYNKETVNRPVSAFWGAKPFQTVLISVCNRK